jgi:ATP-dependent RNA helicase SUPV3L1/SUV3
MVCNGPSSQAMTSISALLGPTNTGKTHRAIERMLEHRSGMMGLPLRLLAREVYDRVSAQCGEGQVALVTGEEKRIPARPRYWVCTVEAMPMSTEVDFLAIDEIQLAAHPERGHVFTERLLTARGREETWFMGSEAMRELVGELVPTATVKRSPRLSTLRHAGASSLASLPKRSAVVAFSLTRVFELGDRLRQRRGGAAIVIGALSPRARNAQVAMYQAKEVDFLVATDAIGMGLNLDIDHVTFADMRKFDGRVARELDVSELAQIAGRAGRYVRDGTFGTLAPTAQLPHEWSQAIEQHRFPRLRTLVWRNAELDFDSLDALLASLARASTLRRLKRVDGALDHTALAALAARAEIRALARGPESVQLLWSACSIPDYRQLLFEEHVALVGKVFVALATRGRIDRLEVDRELDLIERGTTDLETLMDRVASIRTWNFVAHQRGWVEDAGDIQERARKIEDDLSDALHAALVARFVESGKTSGRTATAQRSSERRAPTAAPSSDNAASPFARLAKLREALPSAPGQVARSDGDWLERVIDAPHEQLELEPSGFITFEGRKVGRLTRGRSLSKPDAVVTIDAEAGLRLRLSRRLLAWARDLSHEIIGAIDELEGLDASGRGLSHLLASGLGTVVTREARAQLEGLSARDRAQFEGAGVVLGAEVLYVAASLKPSQVQRRVAFAQAFLGLALGGAGPGKARVEWPGADERSLAVSPSVPPALYAAIGYPVVGRRAVRADLLERLAGRLGRAEEPVQASKIAGWLGCRPADAEVIAAALLPGEPLAG